ncbi:MAG: ImmA/IrrE family metallo-endopeptidase [Cryobacterium sp.]|nr:ImmA/IrrE family metallo-endopeptidase [Cryobacterium sp.]
MSYTKAALARLATESRREIGLSDSVPFDPHLWSKVFGVPFVSLQELAPTTTAVDHFLRDRPERWSAAIVKNGSGHLVVYNNAHAEVRVRSDLAHEVAHLVAEHVLNASWRNDHNCSGASKLQETEATELAGALLVPVSAARMHAVRGGSPDALALKYAVSLEMATWRMRVSGGEIIAQRSRARRA